MRPLELRRLHPGDASLVLHAAPEVFDHAPAEHWTAEFLADPRHHMVGAVEDGILVGFVSAVHYVHPDKGSELWINEVGVAPSCQGRGIGRGMMTLMLTHARTLGCHQARVLTDRGNPAAMRLYASAGGTAEASDAVMFEFDL